jgi:hypothetical protein
MDHSHMDMTTSAMDMPTATAATAMPSGTGMSGMDMGGMGGGGKCKISVSTLPTFNLTNPISNMVNRCYGTGPLWIHVSISLHPAPIHHH